MSKADSEADIRLEYDFSAGVRGKYADRYAHGRKVVMVTLDPDVAQRFPTSESVNRALRELANTTRDAG